jgi:predicted Zn-dependent protease
VVMAHEIAHAIAQHGAERALQQEVAQGVGGALAAGLGGADPTQRAAVLALFGAGAQYGVLLPFGRDQESEADRIGLIYMARAGYDPRAATGFWERMAAAQGGAQAPEYASTHPSHEQRIADLEGWMPEALQEFEAARAAAFGTPALRFARVAGLWMPARPTTARAA